MQSRLREIRLLERPDPFLLRLEVGLRDVVVGDLGAVGAALELLRKDVVENGRLLGVERLLVDDSATSFAGTDPSTRTRFEPCSRTVFTYRGEAASVERLRNCSVVPVWLSRTVRLKTVSSALPGTGSMRAHRESPQVPLLAATSDKAPVAAEAAGPGMSLLTEAFDAAPPLPAMRTISASPPPFWKNWATA